MPFYIFVLVISRVGFKGGIWVLIAPIPGHCLRVASIFLPKMKVLFSDEKILLTLIQLYRICIMFLFKQIITE